VASDIVIFDNLTEIKRMLNSDPFKTLEEEYDKAVDDLLNKILSKNVSNEDATIARWKTIALKENHPRKILDGLLKRVSKNTKKRFPEMYRA